MHVTSDSIQSATVKIRCNHEDVVIAAVYCRPRFSLKENDSKELFKSFGNKFIAGGDYNSKHTHWGSRLCNPKGREMFKCINNNNLSFLSGGSPTYWPTDQMKVPDLLGFFVYKGLNPNLLSCTNSSDLSSDHSPVILTYYTIKHVRESSKRVDYSKFTNNLGVRIDTRISLKTKDELESAVVNFSKIIEEELEACSYRNNNYDK